MPNRQTGWGGDSSIMRCQQTGLCRPFLQQGPPGWMSCVVLALSATSTWLTWTLPLWFSLKMPTDADTASTSCMSHCPPSATQLRASSLSYKGASLPLQRMISSAAPTQTSRVLRRAGHAAISAIDGLSRGVLPLADRAVAVVALAEELSV